MERRNKRFLAAWRPFLLIWLAWMVFGVSCQSFVAWLDAEPHMESVSPDWTATLDNTEGGGIYVRPGLTLTVPGAMTRAVTLPTGEPIVGKCLRYNKPGNLVYAVCPSVTASTLTTSSLTSAQTALTAQTKEQ